MFFLYIVAHCVFAHKFCEILKTLATSWLAKSLKIVEPFLLTTLKASFYPKNLTLDIVNWNPMSFNHKPQTGNLDTTIILVIYFLLFWMHLPLNIFIFNFLWTFQWCGNFKDLLNLGTRLSMISWLGMHSRLWGLITHLIAKQFKFTNFQGIFLKFIYNIN